MKPPTRDPRRIFDTAETFLEAALAVEAQVQAGKLQLIAPVVVYAAFATELYLKCLLLLDQQNIPKGKHDLRLLFRALPEATQKEIRFLYMARQHTVSADMNAAFARFGISADFDECLSTSKDAFTILRYHYELDGPKPGIGWMGSDILDSIRHLILKRNPEWPSFGSGTAPKPPPTSPAL